MSPRALRERLSLPRRVRSRVEKLTSCTRKFNGRLLRKSREFRYSPSDSPLSPLFLSTCADGTRHERFGTSLGKLARDKTSVLAAKLGLFCLVSLSLLRLLVSSSRRPSSLYPSLFPVYRLRELPESRNANLTCTTTNGARRKEFEHVRVWEILSRLQSNVTPRWIHMYFAFEYTRKYCTQNGLKQTTIKNNSSTYFSANYFSQITGWTFNSLA